MAELSAELNSELSTYIMNTASLSRYIFQLTRNPVHLQSQPCTAKNMAHKPAHDSSYIPGHKPAHIEHHAWRTAQNSAAYLLPTLEAMRQQNPQLQMLDVGAGPGTMSASFAQLLPEGHVTATDISHDVLSRAREHAQSLGLTNMSFQAADVFALPFPDGVFDVTHAHQVLCHVPDAIPALAEMLRVTRPGGVVAVRESDLEMWSFWPESPVLKRWHDMLLAMHRSNGGSTKAGRQLLSWALAAGVPRENITVSCGTWCYSAPEDKRAWSKTREMVEIWDDS